MASPRRIVRIYATLATHADEISDFLSALGEKSSTLKLLLAKDSATLLTRWGEEMLEVCGVLDGSHPDPYLMEATQTFYWASLYAAVAGMGWDDLHYDDLRRQAASSGITTVPELRAAVTRLVEVGAEQAKPDKLFLLWNVADRLYRQATPPDKQWSVEQLMEADLQEMKKRPYLQPVLRMVPEE